MELLDVLDENGKLTGQKEERRIVHAKRLWHAHVGIWIMNKNGELLFQKRSPLKNFNPNKWTRTGGHVGSGEKPIEGAQREVEEEIGVKIPIERFELIDIKKQPAETNRHFVYNYFVLVDYKIEDYIKQPEEVADLKYMTIEELEEIYKRKDQNYIFTKWKDFDVTIEYLKNKRNEMVI